MTRLALSRRNFLQVAGLATASAAAAACGSTPAPTTAPTTAPVATTAAAAPTATTAAAAAAPTATTAAAAAPTATTAVAAPTATTAAATTAKYSEAPMLAEQVTAGQLPPVEERLPKNPMVLTPLVEVGNYSDTWHRAYTTPGISSRLGATSLVTWAPDAATIIPDLAEKWEINDDATEYTFYLREGLRWSDGEPFTADDYLFWFEDVISNTELTPSFPKWMTSGGEPGKVEKVDDYTIKFVFSKPWGLGLENLAFSGNSIVNYPRHYLEQFHVNYAEKADLDKATADGGFEQWFQLFAAKAAPEKQSALPTMRPWRLITDDWSGTGVAVMERNPYFYKVDTAGNQLPYFDKIQANIVQDVSMISVKIVSGEVDMQAMLVAFADYPLFMENREKGGFDVHIWDTGTSGSVMFINQSRGGEGDDVAEMKELLRQLDFRVALSKSVDRDEMNELFYHGMSGNVLDLYPAEVAADPDVPGYFEFDVDAANALLDGLGLDQRDGDGTRLMPGTGKPLSLVQFGHNSYPVHRDVAEVEAEFLKEVGIVTTIDFVANEVFWPRLEAGDFDMVCYDADFAPAGQFWLAYPRSVFPVETSTYWATRWGFYYSSGGKNGEEPTGDAARLVEMWDELTATSDPDGRNAILAEARMIGAKNMWIVPIFGGDLTPCIVKTGMTNVPERAVLAYPVFSPHHVQPETFFMKA
ncbi:MAG: ABC transporter substrate-binding protein [Anaerolineae bacterium]